ncbi:Tubby F-box protein 6 [Spatholobus suberectus]|nr:Tubby F-box protein 6 [Spatholobus suberectus]
MGIIRSIRSRSLRVVQEQEECVGDSMRQSCWANMPQELLREVLLRIEASEDTWPPRQSVVACAGVCRSWRQITKDIVKTPELSSKITFPISLKQVPPPPLFTCFLLCLKFFMALAEDGKFLLAARKCRRPTCTDYIISLDADDMSKGSNTYVGKLRSNFLGTKFTIYDGQPPHAGAKIMKSRSTRLVNLKQVSPKVPTGNYPVAHISYELNVLGSRGPRRMHCVMDSIPASAIEPGGLAPTQTEFSLNNIDMFPSFPFFSIKIKSCG